VRERYRERLGQHLLAGAHADVLEAAAERAEWTPPGSLTAVLLPAAQVRGALTALGPDSLLVGEDLPGLTAPRVGDPWALLLVPDVDGSGRRHLRRVLSGRHAVIGPPRPWVDARASYDRAARTVELVDGAGGAGPVDSEEHLAELVITADPDALADLCARVLEPLAELPVGSRERLSETLLSWLLHLGRRELVAGELHVHPQTVRYRMGQLRDLYGDRLDHPRTVRDLVVALAGRTSPRTGPERPGTEAESG
jgi:hypothetical protein